MTMSPVRKRKLVVRVIFSPCSANGSGRPARRRIALAVPSTSIAIAKLDASPFGKFITTTRGMSKYP